MTYLDHQNMLTAHLLDPRGVVSDTTNKSRLSLFKNVKITFVSAEGVWRRDGPPNHYLKKPNKALFYSKNASIFITKYIIRPIQTCCNLLLY